MTAIHLSIVGTESNFEITNPAFVTTQGIPYDCESIMHYSSTAFSRNGQATIVPVARSACTGTLGQREGLTSSDRLHVTTLYCDGGEWSSSQTLECCFSVNSRKNY